jgi:hypothetical protein
MLVAMMTIRMILSAAKLLRKDIRGILDVVK